MAELTYQSLLSDGASCYEEKKSVFYGFARPVKTEEDAINFVNQIKKQYPDARHHVYAYALRDGNKFRYTDDSEPAGTAGMPTLDAIRKRGLTDCVVVVVRYFGGTLLGTGGLVKAYSTAAGDALHDAHPICYNLYATFCIQCDYGDYQKLLPLLKQYELLNSTFEADVSMMIRLPSSSAETLTELIKNATSARAKTEIIEEKMDFSEFYQM